VTGVALLVLLIVLPLLGVAASGKPVLPYLHFPPLTQQVQHAGFSWIAFVAMALLILIAVLPFDIWVLLSRRGGAPAVHRFRPFPVWGWLGLLLGLVSWFLNWVWLSWLRPVQMFLFFPLWLGYIIVVNALAYRRTGRCMLRDRTGYFIMLFVASSIFWWFFEYLNRFVENWYYVGHGVKTPLKYLALGSLHFSTVLPAVLGTYQLLESIPRIGAGLDDFLRIRVTRPRALAGAALAISALGLMLLSILPDLLFPLLWVSPLVVITTIQTLGGQKNIFTPVRHGRWRHIYLLAMSALICGFFWEMWNSLSMAKWIYSVPFVERFRVFEMPILGFAGYLPFGLECAVVADFVGGFWRDVD
jgi:hypothetical protein